MPCAREKILLIELIVGWLTELCCSLAATHTHRHRHSTSVFRYSELANVASLIQQCTANWLATLSGTQRDFHLVLFSGPVAMLKGTSTAYRNLVTTIFNTHYMLGFKDLGPLLASWLAT